MTPPVLVIVAINLYQPGRGQPGWFCAETEAGAVLVERTRIPFLDGARALIATGADPETLVTMRLAGSAVPSFRSVPLRVAAGLTVEEAKSHSASFRRFRLTDCGMRMLDGRDPAAKVRSAEPGKPPLRPTHRTLRLPVGGAE